MAAMGEGILDGVHSAGYDGSFVEQHEARGR
jgi:hypothetical protein